MRAAHMHAVLAQNEMLTLGAVATAAWVLTQSAMVTLCAVYTDAWSNRHRWAIGQWWENVWP